MCSRAVGREGHSRQMSLACVGSTHSVLATLGLPPASRVCVLPPSTLLRLQAALQGAGPELHALAGLSCSDSRFRVLHKDTDSVGPAFCAFPGQSSSGIQELDKCTLPRCGAHYPLRRLSLSFRVHWSGVPCVCSGELVSSRDPPGRCQPSRISGSLWLETGSLFAVW